jgi:hypothetical protein
MGHGMCRECHQLIREEARTCPLCGVRRPVVTHDPDALFPGYRGRVMLILLLLAAEIGWIRYQVKQFAGPPPAVAVDSILRHAPIPPPLGRESYQLGPRVKVCPPDDPDCVPMVPVACPTPWGPESRRPAPPPPSPGEPEWCEANGVGRASEEQAH